MDTRLVTAADGVTRCWWCGADPLYVAYHDNEWGRSLTTDSAIFEKLCLEGFQSGLSWLTILRKRDNFRRAFAGFDIERVAAFDDADLARLLGDAGIVRHRGKIASTINNARRAGELIDEVGSLAAYVDRYRSTRRPGIAVDEPIPTQSVESVAMSKDLKRRGWSFVGPTTMYAFLQSSGLVDDHIIGCAARPQTSSSGEL